MMSKETLPVRNRSCRDVLCLLVFSVFSSGALFIMVWAWSNGDVDLVLRDHDVAGNVCGRKDNARVDQSQFSGQDMSGKPFLYYDLERSMELMGATSVERMAKCLANTSTVVAMTEAITMKTTNETMKTTNETMKSTNETELVEKTEWSNEQSPLLQQSVLGQLHNNLCRYCVSQCPSHTTSGLWRCLPLDNVFLERLLGDEQSGDLPFFTQIISDLRLSLNELLYLVLIALALSIAVTIAFRFLANVIIYVVLAVALLAGVGGALFLWFVWKSKRDYFSEHQDESGITTPSSNSTTSRLLRAYSEAEVTAFLVAAIALSIVAGLMILAVLVLWRRIALLIQLFKEAAKAVHAMPIILLQPLWTLLGLALVLAWWTWTLLLITSTGSLSLDSSTGYTRVERETEDSLHVFFILYHLFSLFWFTQFVLASQLFVTSSMVVTWYFSAGSFEVLGTKALTLGLYHLLRFHVGSLALGSFVIGMFKFLRTLITLAEKNMDELSPGVVGSLLGCFARCGRCCLGCCESLVKALNRNAYIEMALFGTGFFASAKRALATMTNNVVRLTIINTLGDLVLFLAKMVVVLLTLLIGIEMLEDKDPDQDGQLIHHEWPVLTLAAINAFVISDACLSVYEMAVDSLFICFCEDCRINDGSDAKPYCMSHELKGFLAKSNAALKSSGRQVGPKTDNNNELTKVV